MAYQEFGSLIRNHREKLKMTQHELADACGLTRTSITHIESGYQRVFLETAMKIAEILGIPAEQIQTSFKLDNQGQESQSRT